MGLKIAIESHHQLKVASLQRCVVARVNEETLESLENGITIDGVRYGEIEASLETQMTSNAWVLIAITEGKNRKVRRIVEHLG